MQEINLGKNLQILRKKLDYTQKDFADFLGIPQPSLSAYENNRNSPTTDVLINVATKCNVSLDWLCGLSDTTYTLASLGDISELLYQLLEINEIGIEIEVHDHLNNDLETETDKWYTRLTVYGNDDRYQYNAALCNIIKKIHDNYSDLGNYGISKDMYDMERASAKEHYSATPVTKKRYPELSREERMRKHLDYLKIITSKPE